VYQSGLFYSSFLTMSLSLPYTPVIGLKFGVQVSNHEGNSETVPGFASSTHQLGIQRWSSHEASTLIQSLPQSSITPSVYLVGVSVYGSKPILSLASVRTLHRSSPLSPVVELSSRKKFRM